MECLDPLCTALSQVVPPPLMVLIYGVMCSSPLWGIFFVVPWVARYKRRRSPLLSMGQAIEKGVARGYSAALLSGLMEEIPTKAQVPIVNVSVPPLEEDCEEEETPPVEGDLEFYEFAQMWLKDREENPHLLLDGPTGAGKTVTAEVLGKLCIANGDQLLVINPNHKEGQWSNNVITVDDDGEIHDIEATFKWLIYEVKRRGAVLKSEGPAKLSPLVIFWDELPETIEDLKIAAEFLRRALRRGRAVKMHVVGIVQLNTGTEMSLKGRAGLRRGFKVLLLGETARMKAPHLFPTTGPNKVERPALLLWQGASYTVDRVDLHLAVGDPFKASSFVTPDFSKIADVDTVRWTARHVQAVAILLKNPNASITLLTKELFPKSKGAGPYREKVKVIVAEVRAALTQGQKAVVKGDGSSVDEYDEYEEEDEPLREDDIRVADTDEDSGQPDSVTADGRGSATTTES